MESSSEGIIGERRLRNVIFNKFENELQSSTVARYILNLSTTCDFPEQARARLQLTQHLHPWNRRSSRHLPLFYRLRLKKMFVVPRLNKFHEGQNRITKFHLVEAFLGLLVQLLYHKTDHVVDGIEDGIENLEKELRFVLTVLGDISWILCHNDLQAAEFQNLLPQFEAVANQAGTFVYYLFFSGDRAFEEMVEGVDAVLNRTDLLKANLESFVSIPVAYTTPKTSIIDSILILDSLVDDVEDLLKREDDPIADVKDQVNLLHRELLLSHSSIKDMRSPQPSEIEELKEPLTCIGGIAHQAEYLITSFLVNDVPLWYVFNRLTHLNFMIEPIRKELQLITLKYQFEGLKVAEYFSAELPRNDKRNATVNDVTVGFEDKTIEILDQLIGGGTRSLQIISILGMPGLGKTTLANKLYNHPSVSYRFGKLSWCVVSQTYKRQNILATILIHINSELGQEMILGMEETSLVDHIHKTLIGRRYLIALDDIWDSNVLDELVRCFPDDRNGSKILVTSRNKDVAPPNSVIHELPFLSDEQCWQLLQKKVFGDRTCPPELQGMGKKIAARCCGLPLTVVVIAGVLSTVNEGKSRWKEVGVSLASYIDGKDNSVMQILELSYNHLPDRLKPCFLYFGEFKEDEKISIGELKRLWVAEGFVRKEKDKSAENIAGEYLLELIDRSLVMVVKRRRDGRGAKSCIVHDLLRDLCLKISKEESFLKYLNNDYLNNIFEKGHRIRANGDSVTLSFCQQYIRSFVADGQSLSFSVWDMKLMRVLYFKVIDMDRFTFGTEYLVNLRFLVIGNLPTWIERLVNLEYLRVEVEKVYESVYLPPTILKMKKLRYLRTEEAEYKEDWDNYQTNNLEYLSKIIIRKVKDEEFLKCSPHVRKLKCIYEQRGITYPSFDLRFLSQLHSLSLNGHLSTKGDFGFPLNIKKLTLCRSWLRWEEMSIVGKLEFLEVLKLYGDAFLGERWDTRDGEFQKLRFLQLNGVYLYEWNVDSSEHFPELQQLILVGCKSLQTIPSEVCEITSLELIKVKWCRKSVVESAERIKEEQRDMGNEDLRVIITHSDDKDYW